jgi:hypothetical protein
MRSSPAAVRGRIMTEAEFVSRFQREPTGSWICVNAIKIDGPNGPLFIRSGQSFSPGALFLGIDLARELDRMAAVQRAASKLAGGGFASAA